MQKLQSSIVFQKNIEHHSHLINNIGQNILTDLMPETVTYKKIKKLTLPL